METKNKVTLTFVLAFTVLLLTNFAVADGWTESGFPDIKDMKIYVDDALVWNGYCDYNGTDWNCLTTQYAVPAIERGATIEVTTVFTAGNHSIDKVKAKAWISGHHSEIKDKTDTFDVFANNSYSKNLVLEIPADIDAKDSYTLHIAIEAKTELSGVDKADIAVEVQRASNLLEILSIDCYSSEGAIEAGSNLYVDVVVKNRGNYEAEDVYVSAAIADLDLTRSVYLGDLGANDDDDEDAEKVTVVLQLPENAAGSYLVEVRAYNAKTSFSTVKNIVVAGEGAAPTATDDIVIAPQITTASIEQGEGAAYTVEITNHGSASQDVIVSTEGTEGWATVQINPQTFSLGAGETETVSIYVVANEDAVEAEHIFSATVEHGGKAEQFSLTANVGKAIAAPELKTTLMIVAVVLAVIIIVLLIILLTHRGAKEAEETYY